MRPLMTGKFILLICALTFVTGCAMLGGDDEKSGDAVSSTPRKKDSVTMRNNDVLMGRLDFKTIDLKTSYLPTMTLRKDDIDTIEFYAKKDDVKVRTKSGDILRGTLSRKSFKLVDTSLPEEPVLQQQNIKMIHCR